jgi:DNA-binding NtrC family response regulator
VLLLAEYFLEKFTREFAKPGLELSPDAKQRLVEYRWPGNVRELQNTLERAVILADGLTIRAAGLQLPSPKPNIETLPDGMLPEQFSWDGSLEEVTQRATGHVERVLLESTLRDCQWNKTRAAERLGVSPKTLLAKIRSVGLEE